MDTAQAAKVLAEALGRETVAEARSSLASALAKVSGRMGPTESARVWRRGHQDTRRSIG